jgi:hypothetical protein
MSVTDRSDLWIVDLRTRLIDVGYQHDAVDAEIANAMSRFRTARISMFVPLLVERAVTRALDRVPAQKR